MLDCISYRSPSPPPPLLPSTFCAPPGSWSASWLTPGAVPWEEVATTACASSSRPESARRPPGSPAGWSRGTNWRRLLRWWREKGWPADWWRSARQELSSSGKASFWFCALCSTVDFGAPELCDTTSPSFCLCHLHFQPPALIFQSLNVCFGMLGWNSCVKFAVVVTCCWF